MLTSKTLASKEEEFVFAVSKFLKENFLPRKAILLMDNAPPHTNFSEIKSGCKRIMFLPLNVTFMAQPMDQAVLKSLKKKYRSKILNFVLTGNDDVNLVENMHKVDVLDVIRWISMSWEEIPPITFVRSWRKLLDHKANYQ